MTTTYYLTEADGTPNDITVNIAEDTGSVARADCAMCGRIMVRNAGAVVYAEREQAARHGHVMGTTANETTRQGSVGFIDYSATNDTDESVKVILWNADGTPYPVTTWEFEGTAQSEPSPVNVPTINVGDQVTFSPERYGFTSGFVHRVTPGTDGSVAYYRIHVTDDEGHPVYTTGGGSTTLDPNGNHGALYATRYAMANGGPESVEPLQRDLPTVQAPTPAAPEVHVVPRTAAEAQQMANLLRSATREYRLADMRQELLSAVDKLALMLPGGKAEQSGRELAERKSLCEVYETTVCPALGWEARPEMSRWQYKVAEFGDGIAQHEAANADASMVDTIIRFAERYESGDVVNKAILDSMRDNLESSKHDAANQVLEALGMETLEDVEREYSVAVRVSRTIEIEVEQTVHVTVTASDEDHATDLAMDDYFVADYLDDYDWADENGDSHYAPSVAGDITLEGVDHIEVV